MFKVGDDVFIKAEITDVHEGNDKPYFVMPNFDSVDWVSEEKVFPADKTYTQGLADAWELAKKILEMCGEKREEILGLGSYANILEFVKPQEALAKIEAYEKEKEIKVGDVVECSSENHEGIVTCLLEKEVYIIWSDGSCGQRRKANLKKTGKTAEGLTELLRQIGE